MERLTFAVSSGRVEGRTLSGIAHVYGTVTVDGRQHSFAPGFFSKSIAGGKMAAYWGHSPSLLRLGSQKAGTLRLTDSGKEVELGLDLPHTTYGDDFKALMDAGEEVGVSFEVYPTKFERRSGVKIFTDGLVSQINFVDAPAFEGTSLVLNSAQEAEPAYSAAIKISARRLAGNVIGSLSTK